MLPRFRLTWPCPLPALYGPRPSTAPLNRHCDEIAWGATGQYKQLSCVHGQAVSPSRGLPLWIRTAVQEAKNGPHKDVPQVTPAVSVKYATDLQLSNCQYLWVKPG